MNISKYRFKVPEVQLFRMTPTLVLRSFILEQEAIIGLAFKNRNLHDLLQQCMDQCC